jgi:hypothetical protein
MTFRVLLISVLLTGLFAGCNNDDVPQTPLCQVVSLTDQLDVGGKLTDQMQRTFTYSGNQLTQLGERNTDRQVNLKAEYSGAGAVIRASDEVFSLAFGYAATSTQPVGATATRSGVIQAIYEMNYNGANKLTRVLETRQVIPINSLVRSRDYSFVYDADGLLKTEKLTSTLTDRATVEQETDFTYGTLINPMANFSQPGLLTVMALSQLVETMPGRFWQQRVMQDYKTYNAKNGTRSTLRESATFTLKTDQNGRLAGQEQNTTSTSGSGQTTQRKNQHTVVYDCK